MLVRVLKLFVDHFFFPLMYHIPSLSLSCIYHPTAMFVRDLELFSVQCILCTIIMYILCSRIVVTSMNGLIIYVIELFLTLQT